MGLTAHEIELLGHRVSYRRGGDGPMLLCLRALGYSDSITALNVGLGRMTSSAFSRSTK
jgi:hypothetical protein